MEPKPSSPSQNLERNDVSPACVSLDAELDHEEEDDWNVHSRGRHDFLELDHINHEKRPSFDAPAHRLRPSAHVLEDPSAVSRLRESCSLLLHDLERDHVMEEENANVVDKLPSFDAPAHRLGPSSHVLEDPNAVSRLSESCNTPVLHDLERDHIIDEENANVVDDTSPEEGNADDEPSPEASNEEKSASATLLQADAAVCKKRKLCATSGLSANGHGHADTVVKKARKRPVNVWAKSSSRKGGKKNSKNGSQSNTKNATDESLVKEDCVYLTLASKHQDKIEDGPDLPVVLSKFHKAEKIELSDDRLSAGNTKGYRMVRATRGVIDGAWYFEILVEKLGHSGHTRLGWSTQKGEIQAPVGFDNYSYAYRDIDGGKVHMAVREPYGQPYAEGDVIGFYINLPNGAELAPNPASLVSYRGQPYILDEKEEPPKIVPGSEIAFFKNGIFQGTAFKDICAGRFFPAASMYTLPNEPKCIVKFYFGPDFRFPPKDIGDRPIPQPIACAPHCGIDSLGFGSMAWKCESSGVDATHTPDPQRTGE